MMIRMKVRTKPVITTFGLMLLVAFVFQSCQKNAVTPTTNTQNGMKDLLVPDGFTFQTTVDKSVTIKMPFSMDFSKEKSRFNIYTAAPDSGGKLITSGSFDSQGQFSGTIRIPTALDSIYVQTVAGNQFVTVNSTVGTKAGGITVNIGANYGSAPPDTIPPADTTTKATVAMVSSAHFTGEYKAMLSDNLIGNGDFETDDFGKIDYWNSPHAIDGRWYLTDYYYGGLMQWVKDGNNHVVATPRYYENGGASQWISAKPGDLITFTCDVKGVGQRTWLSDWLYIIPLNAENQPLAFNYTGEYQPSTKWHTLTVAANMPQGTVKVNILIWTNNGGGNGQAYFDNVNVTGPIKDSDGDGVNDQLDDYPNDPTRAFNVYYPNKTDWGTLAYEDLWPGMGDYDFNDLVLDYHFKSVLNATNQLVEFYTDYSVRAVGASLKNGFGFMLGGDPSNVASVTGTHYTENYVHNNTNGTEQGQTNTVIVLFDNAFSMIGSSGSAFINTKEDVPYVQPDTNELHVVYKNPIAVSTTGDAPYNPFLIVNGDRGKEVHLAGQKPTDLANPAYFGTMADATDPSTGKYYQTASNLPWALDVPVSFAYPVETVDILNAYNHFADWAQSGGTQYANWYMDKSGYRVSTNIYTPPAK
ncbi:MAG: LruC domain-containing protein [Bacteroidales bacterium]|nr:LruC domain-containing protein [Bacteroidales bacterium]